MPGLRYASWRGRPLSPRGSSRGTRPRRRRPSAARGVGRSSASHSTGSSANTVMSAQFPRRSGRAGPRRRPATRRPSCSRAARRAHRAPGRRTGAAALAGRPAQPRAGSPSRGSKRATGQSEPSATRAPDSSSERIGNARSQRAGAEPPRPVVACGRARATAMCCACIDAITPSAAKRGRSLAAAIVSMCSMRWRTPGAAPASR